eukprot:CAMPEP_0114611450 /NCGR_PEP_ID=MMETSP0168-20121206/4122_1 /TAXON_ID=95228 ORGANISM="Vannella sp., Strain DIVA3 517/6/12" /NCGR_SAMPLE_ID=MMETSP0168 /ASSEMBLY_ACC=CAM_ASM_000044 /LENGTH=641 /DNA_ID=CAMNT_0001822423 /DNA_START=16 /DNA_END=1941 /DNA_ORIENTATION=+
MAPHPKCSSCGLAVYDADLVRACDAAWHQACFKCATCDKVLSLKAYASCNDKPYCAPHFLEAVNANEASAAPSMTDVLKGVDSAKSDLKKAETVDKSAPKVEEGTAVKKVDRSGFLDSVSAGADLKKVDEVADRSKPVIDEAVEVTTVDRKAQVATLQKAAVAREIKKTDSGLKSAETVDKSAPVIESVEIKKVDRSEFTSEVESGKELKAAAEVHDRSAPVIEKVEVKKVDRKGILQEAAKVAEKKDEKLKPTESADRSEPRPSKFGSKKDICAGCAKRVYQMDLLSACGKAWHKGCFRCTHCNGALRVNGFSAYEGAPYCSTHYEQLFKSGGGRFDAVAGKKASNSGYAPSFGGMASVLKGVDGKKAELKKAETDDKSAPKIEEGTAVKKVDRAGFLDSVSAGADLKKVDEVADRSKPVIDEAVEVTTVDRKAQVATLQKAAVAREIKKTDSGLKSAETVDKSAPVIESVEIKKVDRSEFTSEVESGKELKAAAEVHDRSAPVIEKVEVKKVDRKGILQEAAKVAEKKDEKLKPTESADRSEPRPSKFGSKKDTCAACGKRVYPMDLLSACDKAWHKGCFKCTHCQTSLRVNGYSSIAGDPYCRAHYQELFKKSGGTYDTFTDDNARQVFNASTAFKGF